MDKLYIKSIYIKKMLGIEELTIEFNEPQSSLVMLYKIYDKDGNNLDNRVAESPIYIALEMLFSLKYNTIDSLKKFREIFNGEIGLTFFIVKQPNKEDNLNCNPLTESSEDDAPCTSQQAKKKEYMRKLKKERQKQEQMKFKEPIKIFRKFRHHPEHIFVKNNSKLIKMKIGSFLAKYSPTLNYLINPLENINSQLYTQWLDIIKSDIERLFDGSRENPFKIFIQLYLKSFYKYDSVLTNLTKICITGQKSLELRQKQCLIVLLDNIRKSFEYITCDEYTVWYYITIKDKRKTITDLEIGDINFEKFETMIQLKKNGKTTYIPWGECVHPVQDLLYIAFKIALAHLWKHNLVFLNVNHKLAEEMAVKTSVAAFIEKTEKENTNLSCTNYIQRIIDLCHKLNLTAILDFPGILLFQLKNASTFKLKQRRNGDWLLLSATQCRSE